MTCWLCGFETTELATNAKTPTCKNGPCTICIEVAMVDEEINQAVTTLRNLVAKRCNLRLEQNRAHDLVHRLPAELKNYIFELSLLSRDEWGVPKTESIVMPPYLASICRGWHDIAWSNPFLWSVMHIVLGKSYPTSDPSNFMRNWFLRSQTLPLTLHIRADDSNGTIWSKKVMPPVLDAMSQCSSRLQSLSLDIPFRISCAVQHRNFQWHSLMQLRIRSSFRAPDHIHQSLPFLNPTASPERIELRFVSPKSLQISWNRLSSAKINNFDLKELTQLFQYASQMTDCHINSLEYGSRSFTMPPIIHHRLKTLRVHGAEDWDVLPALFRSLTLPCLQECHTDEMDLLKHLHALVQRSSCPLTRLTLFRDVEIESVLLDRLQPLPGVTDLVVESLQRECQSPIIKRLLLEEYFPDLRHLTLRLQPFLLLWDMGIVPLYLDRKRPRSDRLQKFLVVDDQTSDFKFEDMWNSDIGERLKELNVRVREDGFEFL